MIKKFFGEVRGIFNTITLIEMVISIVFIAFGVLFFVDPKLSETFVSTFTGVILIIAGLATIFSFLKRELLFRNNLVYGILLTLLGISALIFKNVLIILLASYFIIDGVKRINYGIILRNFDESSWVINSTIGFLFIVVGIVSILTRNGELIKAVGLCLLFYGIINIVEIIMLRRRSKYFL